MFPSLLHPAIVIPAKAGIQGFVEGRGYGDEWIPAFAGMTETGSKPLPEPVAHLAADRFRGLVQAMTGAGDEDELLGLGGDAVDV